MGVGCQRLLQVSPPASIREVFDELRRRREKRFEAVVDRATPLSGRGFLAESEGGRGALRAFDKALAQHGSNAPPNRARREGPDGDQSRTGAG